MYAVCNRFFFSLYNFGSKHISEFRPKWGQKFMQVTMWSAQNFPRFQPELEYVDIIRWNLKLAGFNIIAIVAFESLHVDNQI
jgi:hypothetical protein